MAFNVWELIQLGNVLEFFKRVQLLTIWEGDVKWHPS